MNSKLIGKKLFFWQKAALRGVCQQVETSNRCIIGSCPSSRDLPILWHAPLFMKGGGGGILIRCLIISWCQMWITTGCINFPKVFCGQWSSRIREFKCKVLCVCDICLSIHILLHVWFTSKFRFKNRGALFL